MTYPQYTPYPPSFLDNVSYAQELADKIMRNNPLINAGIPSGLMKWFGNYTNPDGSKVNFLWIGEFLPGDPNMGGKPQRGFSLVRDDQTHSSALALFDRTPGTPLVQTISIYGYDGQPLLEESRNQSGLAFPYQQIPTGRTDGFYTTYPNTPNTSITSLVEGRFSCTGPTMHYKIWGNSDAGTTGQVRIRCTDGSTTIVSPWGAIPSAGNVFFDSTFDITTLRGHKDVNVFMEAQVLTGAGKVYCSLIALSNYGT